MARKKQQKKRLKKYQGKYVTADRLDMSKGGRVQKAVGGPFQRDGMQEGRNRAGDMSIGGPGGGRGGPGTGESESQRKAREEAERKAREEAERKKREQEEAAKKAAEEAAKNQEPITGTEQQFTGERRKRVTQTG